MLPCPAASVGQSGGQVETAAAWGEVGTKHPVAVCLEYPVPAGAQEAECAARLSCQACRVDTGLSRRHRLPRRHGASLDLATWPAGADGPADGGFASPFH